jgi:ABC-type Mn2+/Zn2+ transport system permease subunit
MSAALEILLIAVVTAVAASLPGTFLVLRRLAMVSDAISHAILPGIVVAFFLTGDLGSPLLVAAAAATGVLTVALIEAVKRSRLVPGDAAIGLVFPALFALGVCWSRATRATSTSTPTWCCSASSPSRPSTVSSSAAATSDRSHCGPWGASC